MRVQKHFLGSIGLTFFIILFANCGGSKTGDGTYTLEANPPFKIIDAYYQDWVAGIREGGSGTNVHISLGYFSEEVVVEKIYFRKKINEAHLSPQTRNQYVGYFKNDVQKDVIMDIDPVKEAHNTPQEPFPFDLKEDEAVIGYLHGTEMKYTKISDMRREKMLAYPSSRPVDDN